MLLLFRIGVLGIECKHFMLLIINAIVIRERVSIAVFLVRNFCRLLHVAHKLRFLVHSFWTVGEWLGRAGPVPGKPAATRLRIFLNVLGACGA